MDDSSDIIPKEPGKEWRIITPEAVDGLKLIQGEMALRAIADVMGWEFLEVKKPKETELSEAEILETSKEAFGDESYGKFALAFMDWVRAGATATVGTIGNHHHVKFAHSVFWNRFPSFEERLPVDRFALEKETKRAIRDGFNAMQFPFTHQVHFYDRFKYRFDHPSYGQGTAVAKVIPGVMTRERLNAFLQKPITDGGIAPADHKLHGVIGRAFDVLCLASGVKETVDPDQTKAQGEPVPVNEFFAFAEREGVSKGKLQTLKTKIQNAFFHELLECKPPVWGEVVGEGTPQVYQNQNGAGFRTIYLDTISPSTLQAVRGSYERISPELDAVLDAYK